MDVHSILEDRLLEPGEAGVIAPITEARRASLLYDRVFFPTARVPGFEGLKERDIPPLELTFGTHDDTYLYMNEGAQIGFSMLGGSGMSVYYGLNMARRALADSYSSRGLVAIPLFHEGLINSQAYSSGPSVVYEAALLKVPVVSEGDLEWGQVLDFRADPEARIKYRNLRLWLQHSLQASSVHHATEIIEQKIENYEWSLKKHGMKTKIGAIGHAFELPTLVASIAGGTAAGAIGGHVWGAITTGAIALGKVALWVAERRIDLKDIHRTDTNREIAILLDITTQFAGEN